MKYRLQHRMRLTNQKQFKKVFNKKKQKTDGGTISFFYCDNDFSYPRLGIVIPKKSIDKSTERNHFKRVVREWFRLSKHKFRNIDIVVFFNISKQKNFSKEEIEEILERNQKRFYV